MQPPIFDPPPDIRLIAADMDGTLLDDDKELHHNFWPTVEALFERGISFAAASGRQYHTLYRLFGDVADERALAAGGPLGSVDGGVIPEQLHRLGADAGYDVAVTWGAEPGTVDAVFVTPTDAVLTDVYLPGAQHNPVVANEPHSSTKISAVRRRSETKKCAKYCLKSTYRLRQAL